MLFPLQTIEQRGISELLLASDSHKGLERGGVSKGKSISYDI